MWQVFKKGAMMSEEFDAHAGTYCEVLDKSVCCAGENSAYFAEYKIRDLHYELAGCGVDTRARLRLLDFGCGVGGSTRHASSYFEQAELMGVDVSEESLNFARSNYENIAKFFMLTGGDLPTEVCALDAAYAMCAFHHIDETIHVDLLSKVRSRLKPGVHADILSTEQSFCFSNNRQIHCLRWVGKIQRIEC